MTRKRIDLTGKKFGKLTVLRRGDCNNYGQYRWVCRCVCGNEKCIRGDLLTRKIAITCGCGRSIHGHNSSQGRTLIYIAWDHMIQRCTNPNCKSYKNYGARSIKVCNRWLKFENFLKDMTPRPDNMTLDRIDNNGNYEPKNCRWITQKDQMRNVRYNINYNIGNETCCIAEWCEKYKLKYSKVISRINKLGWSIEEALELTPRKRKVNK